MTQNTSPKTKVQNFQDTIRALNAVRQNILTEPVAGEEYSYPTDFVQFMDRMIQEKEEKRKDIIARSGLAPDYAYKLLNGRKKTRERDYIIAICIGAKLDLRQTQHALICSGMLPLSDSDIRSKIIMMGIQKNLSVYHINGHLEDQNLPLIRTASDMPSARISDSFSWEPAANRFPQLTVPEAKEKKASEKKHEYILGEISIQGIGKEPNDIIAKEYRGTAVVTDEKGNHFYLEFSYIFGEEDVQISTKTEEQYQKSISDKDIQENTSNENETLESFNSLIDTTSSEFFQCFLQIEKSIDDRINKDMAESDDTRYFGMRMDLALTEKEKGFAAFIEYYNEADPELNEYFQLIRYTDGRCIFTGSHESRFQELRTAHYYQKLFPDAKAHKCFFQADAQSILTSDQRYRYYYRMMLCNLNQYIAKEYNGFGLDPDILNSEILDYLRSLSVMLFNTDQPEESWEQLLEAEKCIAQIQDPKKQEILLINNNADMIRVAEALQKNKEIKKRKKLLNESYRHVLEYADTLNPDEQNQVFTPVCNIYYSDYLSLNHDGKESEAAIMLVKILDLIENHYALSDSFYGFKRMYAFCQKAISLSDSDFTLAEQYYQKSLKEILKFHLDKDSENAENISAVYANYAKLLMNNIGSEEALIYYGRALEILEATVYNGNALTDHGISILDRISEKATDIFDKQDRKKDHFLKRVDELKSLSEKQA